MKITSKELRDKWINFYEQKGHINIGAVSLVGDGTTGVMFNVAGMQPLMPYLLGQKHPKGKRLCNVQGCIRTVDIDNVGDESHFTFFEMMGNWSLGDYFKQEKTKWTYDFLTNVLKLDKNLLSSTVFSGNKNVKRDDETYNLLKSVGVKPENIHFLTDNWWELEGTTGTPCGPDNEWFYPRNDKACGKNCNATCECGRWVEIGNDVYMQYKIDGEGKYSELASKNVDTGFGLERLLYIANGLNDAYETDLFSGVIKYMEQVTKLKYNSDAEATKSMRIVADHLRTSVMLIGDSNSVTPSNTGAGYILRRILRRAIRHAKKLNLATKDLVEICKIYIEQVYDEHYPFLLAKEQYIVSEIEKECSKFEKTIEAGTKEFEKVVNGIIRKNEFMQKSNPNYVPETMINGKAAFRLYDTFGFPLEITIEMAKEKGLTVDENGFNEAFKNHQELAKTANAGVFKGGLSDHGEMTTKLHTATHIMLAGLKKMFGTQVVQKGSNITSERLRFDFNLDHKMTPQEIAQLEDFVNDTIKRDLPVTFSEMTLAQAKEFGAHGVFEDRYGDKVKVYVIGDVDKQICGGPHVEHTGVLGKFKIIKEEASSSGIRRIKAVLG